MYLCFFAGGESSVSSATGDLSSFSAKQWAKANDKYLLLVNIISVNVSTEPMCM